MWRIKSFELIKLTLNWNQHQWKMEFTDFWHHNGLHRYWTTMSYHTITIHYSVCLSQQLAHPDLKIELIFNRSTIKFMWNLSEKEQRVEQTNDEFAKPQEHTQRTWIHLCGIHFYRCGFLSHAIWASDVRCGIIFQKSFNRFFQLFFIAVVDAAAMFA